MSLLREQGAVFLCDGFNRVAAGRQNKMEASLRRLTRDFPKVQVFVFTCRAVVPDLALPVLSLEGLDEHQKYELAEIAAPTVACNQIGLMPAMLRSLAEHPLLLTLILDHREQTGNLPTAVVDLFRSWLDRVVDYKTSSISAAIEREKALTLIANATLNSPISRQATGPLLKENKIELSVMDDLIRNDAIMISNSTVELVHESLADYLRASNVATMGEEEALGRVGAVPLDGDAFLPVFLMALLPTRTLQKALWLRLSNVSLSTYLKVVRYRGDRSGALLTEGANRLTKSYLNDLLEGVVLPTEGFFPSLKDPLAIAISAGTFDKMAVAGTVSAQPSSLTYTFHPQPESGKKVNVGKVSVHTVPAGCRLRWLNLEECGYRLDSGHLLGIQILRDALLQIVTENLVDGGPFLANERLAGRVRYLTREFHIALDEVVKLSDLKRLLSPHAHQSVTSNAFRPGPNFTISSMLDDIEILEADGRFELDLWWVRLGWSNSRPPCPEVLRALLDEHYRRSQQVYAEVVMKSFNNVAPDFVFFPSLPVRFSIAVCEGSHGLWHWHRWSPVVDWEAAGADVEFIANAPPPEGDGYYEKITDQLKKLGRFTQSNKIWTGAGILPSFDGHGVPGGFDGETSALDQSRRWLKEDLEQLFRDVPGSDFGRRS